MRVQDGDLDRRSDDPARRSSVRMMPHAAAGKPALATGSAPTPPAPNPEVAPPVWLLALLVAIASVGPMSLNIVTPALPGIALALRSDVETVQLALSLYLVTMGISQLVLGTLADRLGRRPVLIGGFMLAVVASLAAIWAGSISALVVARVLQAFGASAGIVMSRAIIRDLYDRERAASMIGWVTMAIMVVPMIVPPLGGFLDTEFGWPSIFICIAAFAATVLTLVCIALPETLAPGHYGGAARFLEDLMSLLLSRPFVCYVVCAATGSALSSRSLEARRTSSSPRWAAAHSNSDCGSLPCRSPTCWAISAPRGSRSGLAFPR